MRSKTILLAECHPREQKLMASALRRAWADAELTVLRDGEAVVEYFLPHVRRWIGHLSNGYHVAKPIIAPTSHCDLLLLNLDLPKLDGLKVLRQLRWMFRDDIALLPPVVALSDSDDSQRVADAYRAGASGYIHSTNDTFRVEKALQQTADYWLGTTLRPAGDPVKRSPSSKRPVFRGDPDLYPKKLASL